MMHQSPVKNSRYLRAASGEALQVPPVWLMRQAGRYLPEYLELRAKHDFLTVCNTPELACEVTMQPIRRFHFDASILFSDILVPLVPMGADLTFGKGHGPRISNPIRSRSDVDALKQIEPREQLREVLDAVSMIRRELPDDVALIGFCGAPFTLACYWIEGGKPEPFARIKSLMYQDRAAFDLLMNKLADMVADYMIAMVEAGADSLQLFDTWAGVLPAHEFREFLLPSIQRIFQRINQAGVPTTYFTRGCHHLLQEMAETGSSIVGLDWRCQLEEARAILGKEKVLQGNLDPTLLFGDEARIRAEVRRILAEAKDGAHIFNLGHGILPQTPISSVEILLDEIRGDRR